MAYRKALWIAAAEGAPVGIIVSSESGHILLVNRHAENLFGYSRTELIGQPVELLVPEPYRAAHGTHRAEFLAAPQSRPMGKGTVLHGRCKDGREFLAEIGLEPIITAHGTSVILSVVDITQRAVAATALAESEQIHQALFSALRDGAGVIQDAKFVLSNAALHDMVGYTEQEVRQRPFTDFIAPSHVEVLHTRYQERMQGAGEPPALSQVQLLRKDGTLGQWVEINARRVAFHGHPASLVVLRDITERVAASAALEHIAGTDPLTELPNRRTFIERLKQALLSARRHRQLLAVLFIDLDGFKPINDRYGHAVGDLVLRAIANRLTTQVRATDTVCRLGGDEFVVLLTDLDSQESVEVVASKLLSEVRLPLPLENHATSVAASIGIALYPKHGEDAELLLRRADKALYQVKRAGKNAYHVWSS